MKLKNAELINLVAAITHLGGAKVTRIVDGKEVEVFQSYRLAATVRFRLAQARSLAQAALVDFETARNAMINHHSKGTGTLAPPAPEFFAFIVELEKLRAQPVEVALTPLKLADLNLAENDSAGSELPIEIMAGLLPLLGE